MTHRYNPTDEPAAYGCMDCGEAPNHPNHGERYKPLTLGEFRALTGHLGDDVPLFHVYDDMIVQTTAAVATGGLIWEDQESREHTVETAVLTGGPHDNAEDWAPAATLIQETP